MAESIEDWIVREARAISGPRTHLQDSEALIQFGLRIVYRLSPFHRLRAAPASAPPPGPAALLPPHVPDSEFSQSFVQGMADRMAVSYSKYGAVAEAYPAKVDAIASLKMRLAFYMETGNTEYLMDVGNFAMIEFMHPRHPEAHYRPTDSAESPGRVWTSGDTTQQGNTHTRENVRSPLYKRDGD
jgi:hypothetical protein